MSALDALAGLGVDGEDRHRGRALGAIDGAAPGARGDGLRIRQKERRTLLPIRRIGELPLASAVDVHHIEVERAVDLAGEHDLLAIGRNRYLGLVVGIVGQALAISPIDIRNVELGALWVVALIRPVSDRKIHVVARRCEDHTLAIGKEIRAGVLSAVIDAPFGLTVIGKDPGQRA